LTDKSEWRSSWTRSGHTLSKLTSWRMNLSEIEPFQIVATIGTVGIHIEMTAMVQNATTLWWVLVTRDGRDEYFIFVTEWWRLLSHKRLLTHFRTGLIPIGCSAPFSERR
jgi:hypothetical protein